MSFPPPIPTPPEPEPRPYEKRPGQITVGELIQQLLKLPLDAPVEAEGCDCDGAAKGAALLFDQYVLIERL